MAKLILYYAHPGQRFSRVNHAMTDAVREIEGITRVDLYADYPRYDINVEHEQERLIDHDVIVWQFPLFWYSVPALLKDWMDLVLEPGFAYGDGGDKLEGKRVMLAISTGGPEESYCKDGYNNFDLRTLLAPLEQTARLCKMEFLPPYVFYGAVGADGEARVADHAASYRQLIEALRDDRFDPQDIEVLTSKVFTGQEAAE
ncbi:NAD(P)H-dependent oxidoreductase [Aestuariibius sp. 2305UL40-4]|uniref:NAD(P)H-dependent oxidoreductase n=1 Tax=Aestuariibius violaceus TaxID=3234132 RepID=UPI00345EB79F